MVTSSFEYFAPTSIEEATSLLSRHRDEARVLAGGHSLVPIMKLRLSEPKYLIDLGRVDGLADISANGGGLSIGAMATYRDIEESAAVLAHAPVLAEAAGQVADPQVRNKGTIGGSLAQADPAGDLPAVVLALGGTIVARTRRATREISADRFFVDLLTTALRPTEILTEVRIPSLSSSTGAAYVKYANKASHYPIAGIAAVVTLDSSGTVSDARVAVTGVGPKASRARRTESILRGKEPTASVIRRASDRAAVEIGDEATEDIHASAEFRVHLARVCCERALAAAVERAGA